MNKNAQRQRLLLRRKALDANEIPVTVVDSLALKNLCRVHIYSPNMALNEIGTATITRWLETTWPGVVIVSPDQSRDAVMDDGPFDVIVVPVVGFDARGNRIGMGGGWYDRFLALHCDAVKIGLAYDECELQKIEPEPHDVRLDCILTPTRLIECAPAATSAA